MVPLLFSGVNGLLDKVAVDSVTAWEKDFVSHLRAEQTSLLSEISKGVMTKDLEARVRKVCETHIANFVSSNKA